MPAFSGSKEEDFMYDDYVILDCETTGLCESYRNGYYGEYVQKDRIVDICICDLDGKILFSSHINPNMPVKSGAYDVHGLSNEFLKTYPTIHKVAEQIFKVLEGKKVICFYPWLTRECLINSLNQKYKDMTYMNKLKEFVENNRFMDLQGDYFERELPSRYNYGETYFGRVPFSHVMSEYDIPVPGRYRRAESDALAVARLCKSMIEMDILQLDE